MSDTFADTQKLPSSVRTVEELKELSNAFDGILASKPSRTDFEELLLQYVNVIELLPECDPRSLGMDWLDNNTGTFAELTNHADPRDFLRRCFTSDFVSNVLYNKELLLMVPAACRDEFILELLRNQSPWSYDWFKVVKDVVPGFNIGEYIFMRLVGAHPDSAFFRDFTKPGKNATTLWSEINAQQFLLAAHAVTSTKPELMFEPDSDNSPCFRQRVEARLNQERPDDANEHINRLLVAGSWKLTSLKNVSYDIFKRLPVTDQHRLLRKVSREEMPCSILFLTELAVDKNHFQNFFLPFLNACIRTVKPAASDGVSTVDHTVSIAEYLELRKVFDRIRLSDHEAGTPGRHETLIRSIDGIYRATLEREAYISFGTLVEGTYPKRKRDGSTEMCKRPIVEIVAVPAPRHVYEYFQNPYGSDVPYFKVGDEVAFVRGNTPVYHNRQKTVYRVHFTLIHRPQSAVPKPGPRR